MNKFISGKLGEVLAFARIGNDTLKKGKKGFVSILGQKRFRGMEIVFMGLEEKVLAIAQEQKVAADVNKEAEKTQKKVMKMRNTYIGQKWDEESELLEWMGFYTGASLVHWKLISGAAQAAKIRALITASKEAIEFYGTLFIVDEKTLKKIGAAEV